MGTVMWKEGNHDSLVSIWQNRNHEEALLMTAKKPFTVRKQSRFFLNLQITFQLLNLITVTFILVKLPLNLSCHTLKISQHGFEEQSLPEQHKDLNFLQFSSQQKDEPDDRHSGLDFNWSSRCATQQPCRLKKCCLNLQLFLLLIYYPSVFLSSVDKSTQQELFSSAQSLQI